MSVIPPSQVQQGPTVASSQVQPDLGVSPSQEQHGQGPALATRQEQAAATSQLELELTKAKEEIVTLKEQVKEQAKKLADNEGHRFNAVQALKKEIANKHKVEDDYKEVTQKLGFYTRENVCLQEKLRVTEEILESQEIDQEEREELEAERKRNNTNNLNYLVSIENDEENLVEDISTGKLHPTKIAKIVHFRDKVDNVCKKCDKTVCESEGMANHMKSHKKAEKTSLKCDNCEFESHDGDVLLNHISATHVKFYKCLVCSMTYMKMEDLVAHVLKEHAVGDKYMNKCAVCGESFNTAEKLIHHIFRVHNMVDKDTLETTEAGHQLKRVWPTKVPKFQCYDCGQDVGERTNLIQHKREKHYKLKNCTSFHQSNYCRFSARECIYIHRPEERQWHWQQEGQVSPQRGLAGDQQVQGGQMQGGPRQTGGWQNRVCNNGPRCLWLANNRCHFRHEASPVRNVTMTPSLPVNSEITSPPLEVNSAIPPSNTSIASGSTIETCMQAIMARLEQLELRMPPVMNLTGFPPMDGGKKTQ